MKKYIVVFFGVTLLLLTSCGGGSNSLPIEGLWKGRAYSVPATAVNAHIQSSDCVDNEYIDLAFNVEVHDSVVYANDVHSYNMEGDLEEEESLHITGGTSGGTLSASAILDLAIANKDKNQATVILKIEKVTPTLEPNGFEACAWQYEGTVEKQ